MKRARSAAALVRAAALVALVAAASSAGQAPLERTLFKDLPANDPLRQVVRTVLDSRRLSMRDELGEKAWTADGFAAAWDRARSYFPGKTYFVVPGTYFMTHGFDPDGRLFMEVHDSDYLRLCVENRRTFEPAAIIQAYGRMREATDGRAAAAFAGKMGRLEPFCRDEAALRGLRKALGAGDFDSLLGALREEDYHMLAGGLMHEGTHAGLDEGLIARLRADFEAGRTPVQWDELLAFMAEAGYHGAYVRRAAADIATDWTRIEGRLGELEGLRKKAGLEKSSDRTRFESVRAKAWASAALLRLRMREIWQSARRGRDLAEGLRRDYVREGAPADVAGPLAEFEKDATDFVAAAGQAIQATELAVRALEAVLDTWDEWAEGRRPFPPPLTDSRAVMARARAILWPEPAEKAAAALRTKAAEALTEARKPG
jgi:hypothetical protein